MAQRSAIPVNASAAIAVLATAICAVLVAAPLWTDTPDLLPAAGVVGFAIAMWVTEAMPQHIVALVMFVVAVAFGIAPPEIVFGGFHASATWLVATVASAETSEAWRATSRIAAVSSSVATAMTCMLVETCLAADPAENASTAADSDVLSICHATSLTSRQPALSRSSL